MQSLNAILNSWLPKSDDEEQEEVVANVEGIRAGTQQQHLDKVESYALEALKEFDNLWRLEDWNDDQAKYFEQILQVFIDFAKNNVELVFPRLEEYASFVRARFHSIYVNSSKDLANDLQAANDMCAEFLKVAGQEKVAASCEEDDGLFDRVEKGLAEFYLTVEHGTKKLMSSSCLSVPPQDQHQAKTSMRTVVEEGTSFDSFSSLIKETAEIETANIEEPYSFNTVFCGMWDTVTGGAQKLVELADKWTGTENAESAKDAKAIDNSLPKARGPSF